MFESVRGVVNSIPGFQDHGAIVKRLLVERHMCELSLDLTGDYLFLLDS